MGRPSTAKGAASSLLPDHADVRRPHRTLAVHQIPPLYSKARSNSRGGAAVTGGRQERCGGWGGKVGEAAALLAHAAAANQPA